jgi:hypothetical protein
VPDRDVSGVEPEADLPDDLLDRAYDGSLPQETRLAGSIFSSTTQA